MLTQKRLKELVSYDPVIGLFTRIKSLSNNSKLGLITGGIFSKNNKAYIKISIDGKRFTAHRLVMLYVNGEFPHNEVDHINGDGTDNRLCNLRLVDRGENCKNAAKRKDNTTGIVGVYRYKANNNWEVKIGKSKRIGYFSDFFEACCARKSAEISMGFHDNHGRDSLCL